MSDPIWTIMQSSDAVSRIWPDGHKDICLMTDPTYQAWVAAGGVPDPYVAPTPAPQSVLSQDLMAQFTADDATKIKAAVESNIQFWVLWFAMQAQKDQMIVTSARFLAGWAALTQVLGKDRMAQIATALNITV
jgi:hypothetical protein